MIHIYKQMHLASLVYVLGVILAHPSLHCVLQGFQFQSFPTWLENSEQSDNYSETIPVVWNIATFLTQQSELQASNAAPPPRCSQSGHLRRWRSKRPALWQLGFVMVGIECWTTDGGVILPSWCQGVEVGHRRPNKWCQSPVANRGKSSHGRCGWPESHGKFRDKGPPT